MTKLADDSFASTGLTSSYAFLIMAVVDKPGIQPKEISQQMQLTPSTVTRLIEKMEYKKLLVRQQVGRTTEVFPTDLSIELNSKIKESWKELYDKYSTILGMECGNKLTEDINIAIHKLE
jgi:DNA-binding MarR family transcriptional regulator